MAVPSPDVQAIANLLKRERYYRDTAQWNDCRATFHPHASQTYVNVAWYEGNVDDFLQQSARMHKGKVNIVHSSFDPVDIHVNGTRATSEAFCLVTSAITIDSVDYELASHMRLFSRLSKLPEDGKWRLLSVESSYVRDRLVTASPSSSSSSLVMTPEIEAYPKSYRHLALVMSQRGLKPRPSLPHEDEPETIKEIQHRNRKFLINDSGESK